MTQLLILVYADKEYEDFVIPYIYYALTYNECARVEVILDHCEDFKSRHLGGLAELNTLFGERFLVRQSSYSKTDVLANTIRFIDEPITPSEYLYIGDIDILVLDDILSVHLPYMKANALPFSNVVRPTKDPKSHKRLTGLHLCKASDYYPLPDLSDINLLSTNDEQVLYQIMARKGLMVPESMTFRPICGIHLSLNRDPIGRYNLKQKNVNLQQKSAGWGVHKYGKKYLDSIVVPEYSRVSVFFTVKFKFLALIIESLAKDQFEQLQRYSFLYGYDKRLIAQDNEYSYESMTQTAARYREAQDYPALINIIKKMLTIWNDDQTLYKNLYEAYVASGDKVNAERAAAFLDN